MNRGDDGQPRGLAELKSKKRELKAKIRQLEAEDMILEEKFYQILTEIQEVMSAESATTPKANGQ